MPDFYPGPQPWRAPPPQRAWAAPPVPGTRYDHLARTPMHRWWRPIVGTAIVALAYFGVAVVVMIGGILVAGIAGIPASTTYSETGALFSEPVYELGVLLLSLALVMPVVFGTAWLVQRRRPGTLSSVLGRLRWKWMLICLGVAIAAIGLGQGAMIATYAVTGQDVGDFFGWVGWQRFLPGLIVIVVLVPFQAAAEEYIFRGWLLQAFGAYFTTPWPGILLGAGVFVLGHGYTDWGIVDLIAFSILMGWLVIRTGGLEAPIALHVINNVVAMLPAAAAGNLADALKQGSVPWQVLSGTVVQLTFFTVVVAIIAQKRAIATRSR